MKPFTRPRHAQGWIRDGAACPVLRARIEARVQEARQTLGISLEGRHATPRIAQ